MDMGICVYKILDGKAPEEFKHVLQSVSSMHGYQTRSSQNDNLHLPQLNLKSAQGAISYAGVKIWNDIPSRNQEGRVNCYFKKAIQKTFDDDTDSSIFVEVITDRKISISTYIFILYNTLSRRSPLG